MSVAGITRTTLESHRLPGTGQELRLDLIVFAPGVAAPRHGHPVAGLIYILEGMAESAYGDDAPRTYRAGGTLQDEAGRVHRLFRNANPERPLRFLVSYVIGAGDGYVRPA